MPSGCNARVTLGEPEVLRRRGVAGASAPAAATPVVVLSSHAGTTGIVSDEAISAAAAQLTFDLGAAPRGVDVLVAWRGLDSLADRVSLSWSLKLGSAMVLETVSANAARSVLWARPTLLCGTVGELRRLAEELLEAKWEAMSL